MKSIMLIHTDKIEGSFFDDGFFLVLLIFFLFVLFFLVYKYLKK